MKDPQKSSVNNNHISKKYYVEGMHCSACNLFLEKNIKKNFETISVDASYKHNNVVIKSDEDNFPSINKLNKIFENTGYKFLNEDENISKNKTDYILPVVVLTCFIFLFVFFDKLGINPNFDLNSGSIFTSYFIFGLIAGVSSCAALVGSMLLSLSKNWVQNNQGKNNFAPFIMFNCSRILFFLIFGFLLGYLGSFFKISITSSAIFTLLISLFILITGINMLGLKFSLFGGSSLFRKFFGFALNEKSYIHKYSPIIIGAITFFVPCGFTMITQTNALGSGSGIKGALILGSFALGTLPALALISFTGAKLFSNPKFSNKFSLLTGALIVFFSLYTINSQLNVLGIVSVNDLSGIFKKSEIKSNAGIVTDEQYMQMEANDFEYSPNEFFLKSGVKTIWEIYDSGAAGCAKAVYARGLYKDVIYLKPGLNKVEFIAPKPGTYKISCSMGMVSPVTVVVE